MTPRHIHTKLATTECGLTSDSQLAHFRHVSVMRQGGESSRRTWDPGLHCSSSSKHSSSSSAGTGWEESKTCRLFTLANVLQQLATAISSSMKSSATTSGEPPQGLSTVPCHRLDTVCRSFVMLPARLSTSRALFWLDVSLLVVNDSARRTDCKARCAIDTLACRLAGSADGAAALIATTACITTKLQLKVKGFGHMQQSAFLQRVQD